jgi:hypothetical protein
MIPRPAAATQIVKGWWVRIHRHNQRLVKFDGRSRHPLSMENGGQPFRGPIGINGPHVLQSCIACLVNESDVVWVWDLSRHSVQL